METVEEIKTYYIKTYGCQMNENDSERIARVMRNLGLQKTENIQSADVIIYNTCSVRHTAEDRVFGLGANIRDLKEARNTNFTIPTSKTHYSLPITIVTGCMVRRRWIEGQKEAEDREKAFKKLLGDRLSWADIILEITDITRLSELLQPRRELPKSKPRDFKRKSDYLTIRPLHNSTYSAAVPISTGCNEFCTFCIVPYARGKLKHRSPKVIYEEIKRLINDGYKDITLLGQIVNNWEYPSGTQHSALSVQPKNFLELIQNIDTIPGDYWLTFISSYPNYFTDDLISYIANSVSTDNKDTQTAGHVRPYIHVALQSGSNDVLQRMNRKYTIEKFVDRCEKMKKEIPFLNLSTDIIVGFPGETEADFQKTVSVMKRLEFDMAYINRYSERSGTAAAHLEDNIPLAEKKRREKVLDDVLRKTALQNNKKLLGNTLPVLIERIEKNKNSAVGYGRTFNMKNIKIRLTNTSKVAAGDFVTTEITKTDAFRLQGRISQEPAE